MMEHLEAEEGPKAAKQLDNSEKLQKKILEVLWYINNEDNNILRHNMVEAISNCDDGKELSVIFDMYLIDDDQLRSLYTRLHNSLQEELTRIGPYHIESFESLANGCFWKKKYIDLYIYCSTSQADPNIAYNLTNVLNSSKHFSKAKLNESYSFIRCVHLDTGIILRIDISEPYDLHIGDFIHQVKQADSRINELMMFLKIWFKNMNIYTRKSMTKYCLMTLIIFYLQNTDPPILAPVKIIQETIQKNGINFNLNSRCISMKPTHNIHQLIKGFFEFYSSLDFEKVIIAPYLGRAINKADFQNKVFKYPEYETQMVIIDASSGESAEELATHYPVCVQDMVYLNRNIANRDIDQSLSESNFLFLKKCISLAHKKCREPNISIKNLYKSLLVNIIEELDHKIKVDESLTFDIIPLENELKSLVKFADQPLNLRKLWAKAYIAAIPQIITAVYKIDMTLLPPTGNFEFKKIEETKELPLPFEWSFSSSLDLWTGREMKRSNATFMDYQLEQTEKLFAERSNKSEFAIQLKGTLSITITKNFNSLHIEASSNDKLDTNNDLRKFIGSLKWYMRTYNLRHRIHQLESQLKQTKH